MWGSFTLPIHQQFKFEKLNFFNISLLITVPMIMKLKSLLAKPFASYVYKQVKKSMSTAIEDQQAIFEELIKTGGQTLFGKDHKLSEVKTYDDFKQAVP